MNPMPNNLAHRLTSLRKRARLTLKQVADSLGVSTQAVHKWEKGGMVELHRYDALATLYGVDPGWLLTGGEVKSITPDTVKADVSADVPLLSPDSVARWLLTDLQPSIENQPEVCIGCPAQHGPKAFAMAVDGISMENVASRRSFSIGDIVFADPDLPWSSGSIVIAASRIKMDSHRQSGSPYVVLMRELIYEGGAAYWRAINPHWTTPIESANLDEFKIATMLGIWAPVN